MALPTSAQVTSAPAVGLQREVRFSDAAPLAAWDEMLTRLQSPLAALRTRQALAQPQPAWNRPALDVTQQRYLVYVPVGDEERRYALLAFLPPWQEARLPGGWMPVLKRNHTIFVSATRSGNDEQVFERRIPLLLLAVHNLMERYPIDPRRVYIGGFSGGSRVALRIALAYPDIFHGALLNAGSDPIGDADAPLPAAALFEQFQGSMRLFYTTGQNDQVNLDKDSGSLRSMQQWCVQNARADVSFKEGHEVANAAALQRALTNFSQEPATNAAQLLACRSRLLDEMSTKLAHVEQLISNGKTREASRQLKAIDERFGGLAAPRSLELAAAIAAPQTR